MGLTEPKQCARCDAVFECGSKSDQPCWCAAVAPISMPVDGEDCLCARCLNRSLDESSNRTSDSQAPLVEGVDYYLERDRVVFTSEYHLRRGYCCESGCRHCPYGFKTEQVMPSEPLPPRF